MPKESVLETDVRVDFPSAGEVIAPHHYAIRINAPDASQVEVSLNGGPWQSCRASVGYWWYDWTGYLPGRHQVRAQARIADGKTVVASPCEFTVSSVDGKNN